MVVLSGASVVLPEGTRSPATVLIQDGVIVDIRDGTSPRSEATQVDLHGYTLVPGFIDVHVHGVQGLDVLDGGDVIADIARRMPRFGVTAFCPTTVACAPGPLRQVLEAVANRRAFADADGARVLPAHLESNFINPQYCGAQPKACLRTPPRLPVTADSDPRSSSSEFGGEEILAEIDRAASSVGIVTLAPELDRALHLVEHLVRGGTRVSLGHSGATLEEAQAAIRVGARHATHLFNRMRPLSHRDPGLAGAVLTSDEIAAEVICDGVHLHEATIRMTIAAKGVGRVMAITDGTAAAGLTEGARAHLGGRPLIVSDGAARLEDGTLAGSTATMDHVFRFLVRQLRMSLADAARLCSGTAASELGLKAQGRIAVGALADLAVLDERLEVFRTYVGGKVAYSRTQ